MKCWMCGKDLGDDLSCKKCNKENRFKGPHIGKKKTKKEMKKFGW